MRNIPPASVRIAIKELIEELGIPLNSFLYYGVYPSQMSSLTNKGDTKTGYKQTTIKKFLTGLQIECEKFLNNNIDSPKKILIERKLDFVYRKLLNSENSELAPSGGIMPLTSSNYITRDIDDELLSYIHNSKAKLVFIIGGIGSGRSSLLKRIYHEATDDGIRVFEIDFDNFDQNYDVLSLISKSFGINNKNSELESSIQSFLNQKKQDRVLILVDNLDSIKNNNHQHEFLTWAEKISNEIEKLTLYIVYEGKGWDALSRSKILTRGKPLFVESLTKKQISFLLKTYGINDDSEKKIEEKVYKHTLGNPYLTHLIIENIHKGVDINSITEEEEDLLPTLYLYWTIFKEYLTREYDGQLNLLHDLISTIKNSDSDIFDLKSTEFQMFDTQRLLRVLNLFSGTPKKAQVAGFYRKAIKLDSAWVNELEKNYGG